MYWFRYGLYRMLTLFGLVSKYIKTDEVKNDAIKGVKSFLNFDEFKRNEPKFSSTKTRDTSFTIKEHSEGEIRKTDFVQSKESTIETIAENVSLSNNKDCENDKDCKDLRLDNIELSVFKSPTIYGNGEKRLLLLDDVELVKNLYKTTFSRIQRNYGVDVINDFKIVSCIGKLAGYEAYKYILDNHIDIALLDITLGDIIRDKNNNPVEIDGVDIAIKLLEINPNIKFKFISSHTLNKRNYTMVYYFNKFEKKTNLNIKDHYIYKNGDFGTDVYNFLYGAS